MYYKVLVRELEHILQVFKVLKTPRASMNTTNNQGLEWCNKTFNATLAVSLNNDHHPLCDTQSSSQWLFLRCVILLAEKYHR